MEEQEARFEVKIMIFFNSFPPKLGVIEMRNRLFDMKVVTGMFAPFAPSLVDIALLPRLPPPLI
jgi:hypothetical protein